MKRGLTVGGVCGLVLAFSAAAGGNGIPSAEAKTIGKGKMTLSVSTEISGQFVTFVTQGRLKIKKKSEQNCRKSRSVRYQATDPNGQRIGMLAKLSRGNGSYLDRNTFTYDVDSFPAPEEVPTLGGTYTFKASVPKQKDLKSKNKCAPLASPTITVVVPPYKLVV